MTRTTTAQILDALEDAGVQVNAAIRSTVAETCRASVRQLSAAELGDFVRVFKAQAVGNSASHGKPGPVEFVTNATSDPATQQLITDLLAAGFGSGGVTSGDLGHLSTDRLRELHRNHTFQGYSPNAAADGDAAGDLARLATEVRTAVQGASIAALSHLGTEKLKQLRSDLAAAVVATSASTSAVNGAQRGAGAGLAGYSLNAFLDV